MGFCSICKGAPLVISMGSSDFAMDTLRIQQVSLDTLAPWNLQGGLGIPMDFFVFCKGALRISMGFLGTCKGYPLELQWISVDVARAAP